MSYENVTILSGTHLADANLSAKQYYGVKITSTGVALAGLGDPARPLQNKPVSGEQCSLGRDGESLAVAGAGFDRGTQLMTDANGKYITATTGQKIVGEALETSAGDGSIVTISVIQNGEVA